MSDDRFVPSRPPRPADRGDFNRQGGGFDRPGGGGGGYNRPSGGSGGFNRPGGFDRPSFPSRPPIAGPPSTVPPVAAGPVSSLRIREGDREIEVTGTAVFVRQTMDELPTLLARLRGETPPRPASISMPTATRPEHAAIVETVITAQPASNGHPAAAPVVNTVVSSATDQDLEVAVLGVLRVEARPLAVAAIRKRLGDGVTAQQVRRTLERSTAVVASGERPATYTLR